MKELCPVGLAEMGTVQKVQRTTDEPRGQGSCACRPACKVQKLPLLGP